MREEVWNEQAVEDGQGEEFGPQEVFLPVLDRGQLVFAHFMELDMDIAAAVGGQSGAVVGREALVQEDDRVVLGRVAEFDQGIQGYCRVRREVVAD